MADQHLRQVVLRTSPGNADPPIQRANPARARPVWGGRGAWADAEHARRGRYRWLHQGTRLAQFRISRCCRHWSACLFEQLRRRARPPHHSGQADRGRCLGCGMPGMPGDGDLRRRPVPAPVPAGDRLPQPLRLLCRPAAAHHARPRPSVRGPTLARCLKLRARSRRSAASISLPNAPRDVRASASPRTSGARLRAASLLCRPLPRPSGRRPGWPSPSACPDD
jgi:hypothetical protein